MNNRIIYCNNCGKKGHIYKNCYKPIISLGIMCIKYNGLNLEEIINENRKRGKIFNRYKISSILNDKKIDAMIKNKLKFLMVCRKHTLGYIEFIRGNYNTSTYDDIEYIKNIFRLMTLREINNIKKGDFDILWNDLWVADDKSHKKEYDISKNKFDKLLEGFNIMSNKYDLTHFIEYIYKNIKWEEPDWEFPKGRRSIKETDIDCAIREFEEETNFNSEDYRILNLNPISEIFMGNNGINYKYTYYFAQCFNNDEPIINLDNRFQYAEISDIKWLTYQEAIDKIRDYNSERKNILRKVYNLIYYNIYHFIKF